MVGSLMEITSEAWFTGRLVDRVDEMTEQLLRGTLEDGAAQRQQLCGVNAKAMRVIATAATKGAIAFEQAAGDEAAG